MHLYDQLVLYILSQIQHSINEDKVYDINQNVPFVIRLIYMKKMLCQKIVFWSSFVDKQVSFT